MFGKQKLAALVAEFLGAGVLTLVTLRVVYTLGVPYFVAIAVGLAMAGVVFTFAARSWGYFNPAVTLGLMSVRRIDAVSGVMYIIAQLLGGWAAYGVFTYMVNSSTPELTSSFSWQAVTVQAVGTGVFTLGLVAAVYQGFSRAVTASFAGIAMAVGLLIALTATLNNLTGGASFAGGFLNPAVSLGARGWEVFGNNGWGLGVLGPVIGAVVGANVYHYLLADAEVVAVKAAAPAAAKRPAAKKKPARRK